MKRRRRKKKANTAYRTAPLPEWFNNIVKGTCRWCNGEIFNDDGTKNLRRTWHKNCLQPYYLLTRQSHAKRAVKKRDKGICKDCGKFCRYRHEWQLDHEKPLIEANGNVWYWSLENLATRCVECHKKKTIKENKLRKESKRDKK